MSWGAVIADVAGVVGIAGGLVGWHNSRLGRERAESARWRALAEQEAATNDDLRDQVRDLRTVALVRGELDARLNGSEQR